MEERLRQLTLASPWMMAALRAARGLELASWCIGAGAVRNLVWDALHQHSTPSVLADVDLAYFDAADLSPARDAQLQARVAAALPQLSWEVTNQAAVHHWFEDYFGHAVTPLLSLEAAVASWPEYATAVGLCLRADDTIDVIAPHGLDDLFNCVVRRNPARVSLRTYRQRVAQKNYPARWPRVTILHE